MDSTILHHTNLLFNSFKIFCFISFKNYYFKPICKINQKNRPIAYKINTQSTKTADSFESVEYRSDNMGSYLCLRQQRQFYCLARPNDDSYFICIVAEACTFVVE